MSANMTRRPARRRKARGAIARPLRGTPLFHLRPVVLLAILIALYPVSDPRILPPVGPLASDRELVDRRFTRCGRGRGFACVIDGDTFRLGDRRIRIADINAPELASPRCPEEKRLAEQSADRLLELLNQGEFVMVANRFDRTDRYGRELRSLSRSLPGGEQQSIGGELTEVGLAHPYLGPLEPGWC